MVVSRRFFVVLVALFAFVSVAAFRERTASAYDYRPRYSRTGGDEKDAHDPGAAITENTSGLSLSISFVGGALFSPPVVDGLRASASKTSSVFLVPGLAAGQTYRTNDSVPMFGLDLQLTEWTRSILCFPIFGVRGMFAGGGGGVSGTLTDTYGTPAITGSLDLHPGSMYEIMLPGIGVNAIGSSFYFRAAVQPVFQHYSMTGSYTPGPIGVDVTAASDTIGFDAVVEGCSRIAKDGKTAACLSVSPLLWRSGVGENQPVNGLLVGFGLRGLWGS
jgi:hypothetical protein